MIERGTVIMNMKSGKLYAVTSDENGYCEYIGIKDGKRYGPVRVGRSMAAFVEVPNLQSVFEDKWPCRNFRVEEIQL